MKTFKPITIMRDVKIKVHNCIKCPFSDHLVGEYRCGLAPGEAGRKISDNYNFWVHANPPPDWCPLRKGSALVELNIKEENK